MTNGESSVAVLIPCLNEEQTIAQVIEAFRKELPRAQIHVYDNNSSDRTAAIAKDYGAVVRKVWRKGKGSVLRYMFREIEADFYVLVDGDATYPASAVHELLRPVMDRRADMSVGDRVSSGAYEKENKRPLHTAGNRLVTYIINRLFHCRLRDIMSGYRVFSREFVKNCPLLVDGFEVETVITLHALDKMFNITEVPVDYIDRPAGSSSKLNTLQDGGRILRAIVWIFKDSKPLLFFLIISILIMTTALLVGAPVAGAIGGPLSDALLVRLFGAGVLVVLASVSLSCGLILDTEVKHVREQYEHSLLMRTGGEPRGVQ